MPDVTRREFAQLFSAIFAFLCGVKVPPKDTFNYGFRLDRIRASVPDDFALIERALAEQWAHENKPNPGINRGHGILQDLMLGAWQYEKEAGNDKFDPWLTERERQIVAMVIQWLGTNCGRCFLYEATRRMGKDRAQYPFMTRDERGLKFDA